MIEIRECIREDLPAVRELMVELSRYSDTSAPGLAEIESTFAAMAGDTNFYRNWVALENSIVVGFLSLVIYKTILHTNGTALINELVVDPAYRSRGIASSLVKRAVQCALEEQAVEIEVGTEFRNKKAQKFYKKAGFHKEFLLFNRNLE